MKNEKASMWCTPKWEIARTMQWIEAPLCVSRFWDQKNAPGGILLRRSAASLSVRTRCPPRHIRGFSGADATEASRLCFFHGVSLCFRPHLVAGVRGTGAFYSKETAEVDRSYILECISGDSQASPIWSLLL